MLRRTKVLMGCGLLTALVCATAIGLRNYRGTRLPRVYAPESFAFNERSPGMHVSDVCNLSGPPRECTEHVRFANEDRVREWIMYMPACSIVIDGPSGTPPDKHDYGMLYSGEPARTGDVKDTWRAVSCQQFPFTPWGVLLAKLWSWLY